MPPVREQRQIIEAIGASNSAANRSINDAHCEITLLREYRTRLIADVVTGKLDVREAAARLPDEDSDEESALSGEPELDDAFDEIDDAILDDLNALPEEVEA